MVDSCGWILAHMHVLAGKSWGGNDLIKQVHQGIIVRGAILKDIHLNNNKKRKMIGYRIAFLLFFLEQELERTK